MDLTNQKKWDAYSKFYELSSFGEDKRWKPCKEEFFFHMGDGQILFLAVGPGIDFKFFPPGKNIVGIDISPKMLEKAKAKAEAYPGKLELLQMNAHHLEFPDETFDQVFTACTFCSIPDPVRGLKEVKRVLKPGGELRMFEHTGSQHFPFNLMHDLLNPIAERFGPSINRDTVQNVQTVGFTMKQVFNIYLDVVKTIVATVP